MASEIPVLNVLQRILTRTTNNVASTNSRTIQYGARLHHGCQGKNHPVLLTRPPNPSRHFFVVKYWRIDHKNTILSRLRVSALIGLVAVSPH
jgi:hypothetical protein